MTGTIGAIGMTGTTDAIGMTGTIGAIGTTTRGAAPARPLREGPAPLPPPGARLGRPPR